MTRDEIERFLGELHYDRDDREAPDNYRRGQFKTGWEDWTVRHETYTVDTLLCLTWHNLGYRFGQRFGGRSADEITEVYEVIADLYGVPEAGEGITLRGEVEDESVLLEGVVTGKEIRVVTWNTHRRSPSILSALDSGRPDIVTLQEVTQEQAEAFRARLAKMGLTNAIYTGIAEAEKRMEM